MARSTDTAQLTITIHGTNQAPAAVNDTNAIAEEQTWPAATC
jgi:VCBS repeat-containing protein